MLFIPPVAAIVIFYIVYENRFDMPEDFRRLTYTATFLVIGISLFLYSEIVPIMIKLQEPTETVTYYISTYFCSLCEYFEEKGH